MKTTNKPPLKAAFKRVFLSFLVSNVMWLTSCYIPPVWNINAPINSVDSIKPGVTTKEDILKKLGKPHWQDRSGRSFEYLGVKSNGIFFIAVVIPGCTSPSEHCVVGAGDELDRRPWSIDIEFDKNDVVSSVSIGTREFSTLAKVGPPAPDSATDENPRAGAYKEAGIYCPNADLGHSDAQLRIAAIYDYGAYGKKIDPVRAWVWYSLASQNGDEVATRQVSRLTDELTSEQIEEAKRRLAAWKPGRCMQELTSDENEQEVK
jgi:hypothetical protein